MSRSAQSIVSSGLRLARLILACWIVLAPAAVRRAAAEVFAEHKATLLAATLCEARVAANPISRGVLTAFDWMTGPKWACKNFGDYAAAEAWVRTMLRTVGED
ncbi:MAG TPA: hypothetical protein PKA88_10890 [Polyangiaceae bacterium]|nr:hypothetical protein [Polyangiaceae bacterium]